jgi:acyl dehydratase
MRYFEDYVEGEVIVHQPSRTVTETDNTLFCAITMNPQPLHIDYEFAKTTMHGKPVVNGMYTLSLMVGLSVPDTTLGATLGNLGFSDIKFPKPVFFGDTMTAQTKILSKRLSKSRPGTGIVEYEHQTHNQRGELVVSCVRTGLVMCRPEKK